MQKMTMIVLILCSLIYSNGPTYVKKNLNDSTTILKLSLPGDSMIYTCLDTTTYINTISKLGQNKFLSSELEMCNSNIDSYKRIDSINTNSISTCTTSVNELKAFNDELYDKYNEERETKWYYIIGALLVGVIVGSINLNISN